MANMNTERFIETVMNFYAKHARKLPWRTLEDNGSPSPYKILVSEIMLQQTQAGRVVPKYDHFLRQFPTIKHLAAAPLSEVMRTWNGLGYNRRAKYLHEAARNLAKSCTPWTVELLTAQKGIGSNTAAAILVYAYDEPKLFIETNVRSVFIHHYFNDQIQVADKDIEKELSAVMRSLTSQSISPRLFYWGLMDYGVFLKKQHKNPSRSSKHYIKQSRFEGSTRQLRGMVIKALTENPLDDSGLSVITHDTRLSAVLTALISEGLVIQRGEKYYLAGS